MLAADFFYLQMFLFIIIQFFHFFFGEIKVKFKTLCFMGDINTRATSRNFFLTIFIINK